MIPTRYIHPSMLVALLMLCSGQLLFALGSPLFAQAMFVGVGLHLLGLWLAYRAYSSLDDYTATSVIQSEPAWFVQAASVASIIVLAAVLRLAWLDRLPLRIDGDAAAFALAAADFVGPNPPPLIGTGWQSHTNILFFLQSLLLRLVGRTVLGIRVFSALGGILSVLIIYLLGRRLWNWRVGMLAALTTAVLPFHLVFSRVGTEVVHVTWLLPLVILCVVHGWERRSSLWLLAGGAAAGLSQYFYPGARLIPILLVAQLGLLAMSPTNNLNEQNRKQQVTRLLSALCWAVLGFVLVYGPMIVHFIRHPDAYTARITIVSITSSGWLEEQLQQRPLWQVLGEQIRRAYLPFVYPIAGPAFWYLWPQYLGGVDAALLMLGFVGVLTAPSTARWLRAYLLIYVLLGMLLGGVLTIDTPMPSRYVIFVPAVALLIGWALNHMAQAIKHLFTKRWKDVAAGIVLGGLCAYAVTNVASYLRHDTIETWNADPTSQTASYVGQYLESLPDQQINIYFLQTPMMYYQANPLLAFLTDRPGTNLIDPVTCQELTSRLQAQQNVVIAPPGRIEELKQVAEQLPVSEFTVFQNPRKIEVAAVLRVGTPAKGVSMCAPVATTPTAR